MLQLLRKYKDKYMHTFILGLGYFSMIEFFQLAVNIPILKKNSTSQKKLNKKKKRLIYLFKRERVCVCV